MPSSRYFRQSRKPPAKNLLPANIKFNADEKSRQSAIISARDDPEFEATLFGNAFPSDYRLLRQAVTPPASDLGTELEWYAFSLKFYAAELSNLVERAKEYENLLFSSRFIEAATALNEIIRIHGVSIWAIKQKLIIYELTQGLDAQKQFAQKIWSDENSDPILRFLIHYLSARTEGTLTHTRFVQLAAGIIADLKKQYPDLPVATYVEYHLLFFSDRKIEGYLDILKTESESSIWDRYLAFRRIAQLIVASRAEPPIQKRLNKALFTIGARIRDPLLSTLQHLAGLKTPGQPSMPRRSIDAIDSFTRGDYPTTIALSLANIKDSPSEFIHYELIAKASIYGTLDTQITALPKPTLDTISAMRSLITADSAARQSHEHLWKRITIHEDTAWASQAFAFVQREFNHFASPLPKHYLAFSELNCASQPNPRLIIALNNLRRTVPQSLGFPEYDKLIVFQYTHILSTEVEIDSLKRKLAKLEIPEERKLSTEAEFLLREQDFESAEVAFSELRTSFCNPPHHKSFVGYIRCLIGLRKLDECVDLAADALLSRPNLWAKLPLAEIINATLNTSGGSRKTQITLPIIFEFYSRFVSNKNDPHKIDATEDYLAEEDVDLPSLLTEPTDERGKKRLIHFLRFVCLPTVLDSLPALTRSIDVQRERLAICQKLIDLDQEPANRAEYESEIKEITKSLATSKGLQTVEQSRIYVDTDGLRRVLQGQLADSFVRYQLLSGTKGAHMSKLARLAIELSIHKLGKEISLFIPQDESFELLKTIIIEIRDQFASNNEYGLNSSLSMGIRHGSLAGQIRPIFEQADLITRKDSISNEYSPNTYWSYRLHFPDSNSEHSLQICLRRFSKSIDEYIDYINENLIQINTNHTSTSDAFINLVVTDTFALSVLSQISSDTSFDRFIEIVLEKLWSATDSSLERARAYFEGTAKSRFLDLLQGMRDEIGAAVTNVDLAEFDAKYATAVTEVQYCMQRVSTWFTRAKTEDVADFEISLSTEIANEMIANVFRSQRLRVRLDIPAPISIRGRALTPLSNIFFNLFDNCRKYGRRNFGPYDVSISARLEGDLLKIETSNPIPPVPSVAFANSELSILKGQVANSSMIKAASLEKVAKEGRSGFHKIAKLIFYDMNASYLMNPFYTDSEFKVQFEIDYSKLRP